LIGFRPTTGPVEWLAAAGLLVLTSVALSWLSIALGMVSSSVETASSLPMPLMLLPAGLPRTSAVPSAPRSKRAGWHSRKPIDAAYTSVGVFARRT
jgi:ABC-2 type transport system permease protein